MTISRRFSMEDQVKFARLSGDCNPMHMDSAGARRTQAGAPVVHGVHLLLWTLDALKRTAEVPIEDVSHMRVQFARFAYLGRALDVTERSAGREGRRFTVSDDGLAVLTLTLSFGERRAAPAASASRPAAQAEHAA